MSYPAYDSDRDALATLASYLLDSTALLSIVINDLSEGDFADLPTPGQAAIYRGAHMAICDFLTELGARHPAADIATTTAILKDAINTIAENIFTDDGQSLTCEGRGHLGRYTPKRR